MALDNLNYYSAGLPAGQQTDKYTSQPGCLKSQNLDIFSSSKSVKGTAWSDPVQADADVIKQEGNLVLKTDGKVYTRSGGTDTLLVDPSTNFPVHKVSYTGKNGPFSDAERGTVQDMTVAYEGDEWKSFVVFTDRASFTYSKVKYVPNKSFGGDTDRLVYDTSGSYTDGYRFDKSGGNSSASLWIIVDNPSFTTIPVKIKAREPNGIDSHISLESYRLYNPQGYYYDAELDGMSPTVALGSTDVTVSGDILSGITLDIPSFPVYSNRRMVALNFKWTKVSGSTTTNWTGGDLYIDVNGGPQESHRMSDGDYNYYYSYLPIRDRKLQEVGEYYWMKGQTFQPLYKWNSYWVDVNGEKKTRYDFETYMGWANNPAMDIIGMAVWNEQVYMIGNMNGNGYIIPCDLSGGMGTPYIAYGCEFKGVAHIDYLMYLVGEDRGISQLWVYNGQELVSLVGGNEENTTTNLTNADEQYKFDGKMVEYRGDLVLSTSDNRIFQYGQTFGGKGGVFVHELPGTIKELKAKDNDLTVKYTYNSLDYTTVYQDDVPVKNYNTEWMAEYPIVLGNHLLEKEESDLYVSYILPSANTSLEFWGMANHYHFWTFTSSDVVTLSTTEQYKIKGATGDYYLNYVETNNNQYTFKLVGDLPIQTTSEMKITDSNNADVITYTSYNHFRKIGEITTDTYCEGEFRFHNLNNKLELPKSHSLQIMVKGKGTANHTPELFALDLVANQRNRG